MLIDKRPILVDMRVPLSLSLQGCPGVMGFPIQLRLPSQPQSPWFRPWFWEILGLPAGLQRQGWRGSNQTFHWWGIEGTRQVGQKWHWKTCLRKVFADAFSVPDITFFSIWFEIFPHQQLEQCSYVVYIHIIHKIDGALQDMNNIEQSCFSDSILGQIGPSDSRLLQDGEEAQWCLFDPRLVQHLRTYDWMIPIDRN